MTLRNAVLTVSLAFALAACGTPPKERFYTLNVPQSTPASPTPSAYSVAVGPVSIPEMVDRPQIVVRAAPNRVELSELNRWAEPLKRALPRALAAHMAQALPEARVYLVDQETPEAKDLQVRIAVDRIDAELGKTVALEAQWSVRLGGAVRHGRSVVREAVSGPGYEDLAAAHSAAAAAVGREIASVVGSLKR